MTGLLAAPSPVALEAQPRSPLWPHQVEAVTSIRSFLTGRSGQQTGILALPTGAGKTIAAIEGIRPALGGGARALWLAPSWFLFAQTADEMGARYAGAGLRMGRPPSTAAVRELPGLIDGAAAEVVFCTLASFVGRGSAGRSLCSQSFDLVVLDEAHLGHGGRRQRLLSRWIELQLPRPPLLGLTATPAKGQEPEVIYRCGKAELEAAGVLARPEIVEINTGVRWDSERGEATFTEGSLTQLVLSPRFIEKIARTWADGRGRWGKTLVSCATVEHANRVRRGLYELGASVAVIHSGVPARKRERNLDRFRRSQIQVLVQVAMLNQGVDVPDIESVFIARPTLSRTLYEQMSGRGARVTRTKRTYNLVDFVVASKRHANEIWTGARLFPGATVSSWRSTAPQRHGYEPAEIEFYRGNPAADGLDIAPRQTFGIEFEITDGLDPDEADDDDRWERVSSQLVSKMRDALPPHLAHRIRTETSYESSRLHSQWELKFDGSCGWEMVTPILCGHEGFAEVLAVLPVLAKVAGELGLRVDRRTGTHVHLGWEGHEHYADALLKFVTAYEPAFLSVVSPSRFGNSYCEVLRPLSRDRRLNPTGAPLPGRSVMSRYNWLNLSRLSDPGMKTVEIRLHNAGLLTYA